MKKLGTSVFAFILSFTFAWSAAAATPGPAREDVRFELTGPSVSGTSIQVETPDVENTAEVLQQIEDKVKSSNQNILISSDSVEVLERATLVQNKRRSGVMAFMPMDPSSKNEGFGAFKDALKKYPVKLLASAKSDKIGLIIVTFNAFQDSFIWIHAANYSHFQQTGNVMFTVLTSIVFGINKDAWSQATRPFQGFFKRVLFDGQDVSQSVPKDLAVRFLSNLALTTIISSARLPFVSFDSLVNTSLWMNQWTLPMLISVASTVSAFAWSENLASIDQAEHPISKFVFRRGQEIRALIIGSMAASAMLFSSSYGATPWLVLGTSGALGLTVFLNSKKIQGFLDNNKVLQAIATARMPFGKPIRCEAVFAN
jgi:hypothetical protein